MTRKTSLLPIMITFLLITIIMTAALGIAIPATSAQTPIVSVSKIYNMNEVGATFLVYINVSDVSSLNIWRMSIRWDPTIINITEGDPNGVKPVYNQTKFNIYEGNFLKKVTNTTFFGVYSVNYQEGVIENLWGGIATGGASGSGILAMINFTLLKAGTTEIKITGGSAAFPGKSKLQDSTGNEISHEDVYGVVSDKPPPSPEIWTELWFQMTTVLVVIVILAATYIIRTRGKPKEEEAMEAIEEEEED